ncbi:hypothetical protein P43SY_010756 [Pythium insidiosum]|uniref:Uncharacterized protein n=1 Tax=Pythium insidiosum TaxID=114742 RepID=A0AAD5L5S5_PYTIN|nr:hypothetical protein P43SY_010756 [Pythium insidiosum]
MPITNTSTLEPQLFWPYKYDSTSIAMRAVVQHLRVASWPPCVLYQGPPCDESRGLPTPTVFRMLDDLIDGVKNHKPPLLPLPLPLPRGTKQPAFISLRIKNHWIDRLNHLVLPWLFGRFVHRSVRGIVYSFPRDTQLQLCGRERPARPIACQYLWVAQQCSGCRRGAQHGWNIAMRRLAALQTQAFNGETLLS